MSRLEDKLLELGYKFDRNNWGISKYQKGNKFIQIICISEYQNMIVGQPCINVGGNIETEEHLIELNEVFKILQSDLEVLKQYEKES